MLVAGHIKPWKDSTSAERLDLRNGLAACPATTWPSTPACSPWKPAFKCTSPARWPTLSRGSSTRQYYGRPPLLDTILLPDQAQLPGRKYLVWHRTNIFVA